MKYSALGREGGVVIETDTISQHTEAVCSKHLLDLLIILNY